MAGPVWLPRIFWEDHRDRMLPSGELLRRAGNRVLVNLDDDDFAELWNDALYYAEDDGIDGCESVIRSAKATVAALLRHDATAAQAAKGNS